MAVVTRTWVLFQTARLNLQGPTIEKRNVLFQRVHPLPLLAWRDGREEVITRKRGDIQIANNYNSIERHEVKRYGLAVKCLQSGGKDVAWETPSPKRLGG